MKRLPELLCPAGSPEALDAAIEGGADAVYLGGAAFNARMNAKNFGGDALRSAVLRAHTFGVKVYLTLNTLATDRELSAFVDTAKDALRAGVDALIVADLGGAMAIRRALPGAELHASTQMSGHNLAMATRLKELGFTRMVVAREISEKDLRTLVTSAPIEIEMFIHGALCVSHSGQCLFSSIVGGRSGNRGECAQPCRLPYSCADCKSKNTYPLSLKDLSLAAHVPELIDIGVSSLKIEGRMKAPEYVRDTARIWRKLLDENRAATPAEMQALADAFSRGGFTDGYYTEHIDRCMLGIRSDTDKSNTRALKPFTGLTRRIPLEVSAKLTADAPALLTLSNDIKSVTVTGDIPMPAIHAPLTHEVVERNLSKFGGTLYHVGSFSLELGENLMLPVSRLNDLRRRALQALDEQSVAASLEMKPFSPCIPQGKRRPQRTARFYKPAQITPLAKEYFDVIYLPLHKFTSDANGVVLPPVIFDGDTQKVKQMLQTAALGGAKYALVGNLGHLELARRAGLISVGDFRLNVTNAESVCAWEALGVSSLILSPELTLPQIRDIGGNTSVIVYGRLPLMTLEKCAIRELADCKKCATDGVTFSDRRGISFPILREWEHRNVICNSLPTNMSDRQDQLRRAGISAQHFLFTTESPAVIDTVIKAFAANQPLQGQVRRINV
ncbi:MAG: U32 family peptidase [Clostridia bacterium]|nr:U32 family peptidase [Clostridia bacterium]